MPSWKRILKVPSSNDQTDVKISAAEFHFSAALVFYALTFKNESLFIITPMQNLKIIKPELCDKFRLLDRHTHAKPHGNPSKVFFSL